MEYKVEKIKEETLQDGKKIQIIRKESVEKIEIVFRTDDGQYLWKLESKIDMSDLEHEFLCKYIELKDSIIDF